MNNENNKTAAPLHQVVGHALKACPFCGGSEERPEWIAHKDGCFMWMQATGKRGDMIAAWQSRPGEDFLKREREELLGIADKTREQLAARVRFLERELTDLRLDVWGQYALDMGDGWQSDGALSTLESIADDLMDSGVFEMHPERPWYRARVSPNPKAESASGEKP